MIGNRKEEGRVCTHSLEIAPTLSENRLTAFPKKAKSIPGFKPGLL